MFVCMVMCLYVICVYMFMCYSQSGRQFEPPMADTRFRFEPPFPGSRFEPVCHLQFEPPMADTRFRLEPACFITGGPP